MDSDKDALICNEFFPVFDQHRDIKKDSSGSLMIREENTAPGYTKLQIIKDGSLLSKIHFDKIHPALQNVVKEDKDGRLLWIDVPGFVYNNFEDLLGRRQGPAWRSEVKNMFQTDIVHAMRCHSWPVVANEWVIRKRKFDWPQRDVIDNLMKMGCFLVKVPHPFSMEKDFDWRLSFSLQERHLMHSLTDTQFKCYVVLKLIKKEIIEPVTEDIISSYHWKTCLFYMIEQSSTDVWKPENLLRCVISCLELMLSWVKRGFCPNYFIPKENMFDGKVHESNRGKIGNTIEKVIGQKLNFLQDIKLARIDKRFAFYKRKARYSYSVGNKYSTEEFVYFVQTQFVSQLYRANMTLLNDFLTQASDTRFGSNRFLVNTVKTIESHHKHIEVFSGIQTITEHTPKQSREVIKLVLPFMHTSLACHYASLALQCSSQYLRTDYLIKAFEQFEKGVASDLTSNSLKYAAFLFSFGKYRECEEELNSVDEKMKLSHVLALCTCRSSGQNLDYIFLKNKILVKMLQENYVPPAQILQQYISPCIVFLPTEWPIIPKAMQYEMFRSFGINSSLINHFEDYWYNWAVVDSKVFLFLLKYLVARKLNKSLEHRLEIIGEMENFIRENHTSHRETACNLISWILVTENNIFQAFKFLLFSWQELVSLEIYKKTDSEKENICQHNAAKWHLLILLYKIWFVQNKGIIIQPLPDQ